MGVDEKRKRSMKMAQNNVNVIRPSPHGIGYRKGQGEIK